MWRYLNLSVGDGSELKAMYATVNHIIESGCLMPNEEIAQRRALVSTNLDLIMIYASEKAYCKKLQAYQKVHNVTVLHDMPGNRYFWREKSSRCDAPHFYSPSEDEKVVVPFWLIRKGETALYCTKHNTGPLDIWYDCEQCMYDYPESPGPLCNIRRIEKREPTPEEVKARNDFLDGLPTRCCKIATILRKIPKADAEEYIERETKYEQRRKERGGE